jgi:hypothetical protein
MTALGKSDLSDMVEMRYKTRAGPYTPKGSHSFLVFQGRLHALACAFDLVDGSSFMPLPIADPIEACRIAIAEEVLDDLRSRLANTRWPDRETVNDWSQGAPLERVESLCNYWRQSYNWRRCEERLNSLGQSRTVIDGVGIHFLHIKSPNSSAVPLILTHGWPGSVIEFLDVIGPLTNPGAHGGSAADSFHVVVPSLPGFGFSDKPVGTGWGVTRIATAWVDLMRRLGYEKFFAQGGDWGPLLRRRSVRRALRSALEFISTCQWYFRTSKTWSIQLRLKEPA